MINETFAASDRIQDGRTVQDILNWSHTETGELTEEIIIASGRSYKKPGKDGIVGEAVDVILCMLDIIHKTDPSLTAEQVTEIANRKIAKWEATQVDMPYTLIREYHDN